MADAKYLFVVMMDIEPDKEEEFNRVYDEEHVPDIKGVPGVLNATRYKTSAEGEPRYLAIYEVESPDIPDTPAWKKASDSGSWAPNIRPFTKNRRRMIYERI